MPNQCKAKPLQIVSATAARCELSSSGRLQMFKRDMEKLQKKSGKAGTAGA